MGTGIVCYVTSGPEDSPRHVSLTDKAVASVEFGRCISVKLALLQIDILKEESFLNQVEDYGLCCQTQEGFA